MGSNLSGVNCSGKGGFRQADLLNVVEDLDKRRRRLLIRVVENFVSLGNILRQTRELVEEYKRRKFLAGSDCEKGDCEQGKGGEAGEDLFTLLDELEGRVDLLRDIIGQGLRLLAKAGGAVNGMVVFLRILRRKFQENLTGWIDTGLKTKQGNTIYYSAREGFAEEVSFSYLLAIEPAEKGKV